MLSMRYCRCVRGLTGSSRVFSVSLRSTALTIAEAALAEAEAPLQPAEAAAEASQWVLHALERTSVYAPAGLLRKTRALEVRSPQGPKSAYQPGCFA